MKIYTIGFTKKSAESFFSAVAASGAERVVDVRLNNISQLAGFSKRDNLNYFLREICNVEYVHLLSLAPTQELLDSYKKHKEGWNAYERSFLELMRLRRIEETVSREIINNSCLLCSEDDSHHCHRRLVAEYLRNAWGNVEIIHLT